MTSPSQLSSFITITRHKAPHSTTASSHLKPSTFRSTTSLCLYTKHQVQHTCNMCVPVCLFVCLCPPLNFQKNRPKVAKRICAFGGHPSARIVNLPQSAVALTGNSAALRATAGRSCWHVLVPDSSSNATDVLPDGG
jgi:hypothetical protein